MTPLIINITNCNSIEQATIRLYTGTLNIKYGPNGLGKSSIARAIVSSALNNGALQTLKPFKYRNITSNFNPAVHGAECLKSILVFDESYVSQFVFQQDEVIKNSFDIFINTDAFKAAMKEIDELLAGVRSAFDRNEELNSAISDLKDICDAFAVTKSGVLSKSSKGYKAFASGNKIQHIPDVLKPFSDFIRSEHPASWVSWQTKGNSFLNLSDKCPYCASSLAEPEKKAVVQQVAKEYDSRTIEHLNAIRAVIDRLGNYFEPSCREKLEQITTSKLALSPEESNFLSALHGDIETLILKLEALSSISFFALRNVDTIETEVTKLHIDLTLLRKLDSAHTRAIVDPINQQLSELLKIIGALKGKINKQKHHIEKSIIENQDGINSFLKSAGYKYSVVITPDKDSYKMKLVHQDYNEHIDAAAQHLSYGEKNAFALVLFMHHVLRERPDLAILDDPVSSFDKTKKFAILNELFRGKGSLRDTTCLMLTHDLEPVIDIIRSVKGLFHTPTPKAYFLSSRNGIVSETEIDNADIKTFAQICDENISTLSDDVIRCIYLRRRFEILNDHGVEYNYLSSLLHGRTTPVWKTDSGNRTMTPEEIAAAAASIQTHIPSFDYTKILATINDKHEMTLRYQSANAGYDKLQLFRIYKEVHRPACNVDDIIHKFVNESFHIENEYVMQLNPHKFDNVPEYVVHACDALLCEP